MPIQQRINLYSYLPQPIRSALDAKRILALWGIFFAVLMVIYTLELIQFHILSNRAATAVAEEEIAQNKLTSLAAKYPNSSLAQNALAPSKLAACRIKMSNYLEQTASAIIPGVWLTEIKIYDGGKTVALKGNAIRAVQAQQFLEILKQQPFFSKMDISLSDLTEVKEFINNNLADYATFNLIAKVAPTHE